MSMTTWRTTALAVAALGLGLSAGAQARELEVRSLAEGAASPSATIEDVAWLAGRWLADDGSEEFFSPASGGQMMAAFRLVSDGELALYEFEVVRETEGSIALSLKHFGADLSAWEDKDEWVTFPLVAVEAQAVYFDGLSYRRRDDRLEGAVRVGEEPDDILRFAYTLAD